MRVLNKAIKCTQYTYHRMEFDAGAFWVGNCNAAFFCFWGGFALLFFFSVYVRAMIMILISVQFYQFNSTINFGGTPVKRAFLNSNYFRVNGVVCVCVVFGM